MRQGPEAIHPGEREVLMRRTTYYVFHSATAPDLRGLTGDPDGTRLPASDGPWPLERQINPDEPWPLDVNEAVVEFGVLENGFYLWGPNPQHASSKPVIESDRVEGTAVFDLQGHRIGTIKRLLIEKVTGRVVYVDVTFGGFPGNWRPPPGHPLGEAPLCSRVWRVSHRHHCGAGQRSAPSF